MKLKQPQFIMIGAAALLAFVLLKPKEAKKTTDQVREVLDKGGKSFGNGWRYFSDGTAISPDGAYYSRGQLAWSPEMWV